MAPTSHLVDRSLLWTARISGLGFSCLFLFLLFLFATNEDPPAPAAYPPLVAMSVAVLGAALAWRWRRFGAIMLLLCAAILGVIAAHNALLFDMGWGGMLLVTPLYAGPPFLAGLLYGLSYRCPLRSTLPRPRHSVGMSHGDSRPVRRLYAPHESL